MDDWSPQQREQQRRQNKRTFTQMSELLQPLRDQNPFIASSPHSLPDPRTFASSSSFNLPSRLGHQQHHSNNNPPGMAHRRLPMPTLQHQSSRTVIDLTDDTDVPSSQPRRSSQRSAAPPQLERTDSVSLGQEVVVIPSDDEEEEIQFISENPRQNPPEPALQPALRHFHQAIRLQHQPRQVEPRHARNQNMGGQFFFGDGGRALLNNMAHHAGLGQYLPDFVRPDFGVGEAPPRMPNPILDYDNHPFLQRQELRKQEFVPPPAAKPGFTRSPKEDDVVVCPACDEELMVDPTDKEPGPEKKPSARKKSKADRAEHPFWVLKDCGHVYCNKCYQNRKPDAKATKKLFPQATGPKKTMVSICAVDGCGKEVGDKRSWVGVFL